MCQLSLKPFHFLPAFKVNFYSALIWCFVLCFCKSDVNFLIFRMFWCTALKRWVILCSHCKVAGSYLYDPTIVKYLISQCVCVKQKKMRVFAGAQPICVCLLFRVCQSISGSQLEGWWKRKFISAAECLSGGFLLLFLWRLHRQKGCSPQVAVFSKPAQLTAR